MILLFMLFSIKTGKKKDTVFGWSERYKVAVGVAEALVYLHSKCDQPVIHRDVKSSNILLSDDFEPQVTIYTFTPLIGVCICMCALEVIMSYL